MHLYPPTRLAATNSHDGAAELTPADLDPATHQIVSRHWFGIEPLRPIGVVIVPVIQRIERLQDGADAPA